MAELIKAIQTLFQMAGSWGPMRRQLSLQGPLGEGVVHFLVCIYFYNLAISVPSPLNVAGHPGSRRGEVPRGSAGLGEQRALAANGPVGFTPQLHMVRDVFKGAI